MPDVAFDLPADAGRSGAGLVNAYRYGLFAEGKARIVLDAAGPVRIEKAEMSAPAAGGPLTLEIRIAATTPENFGDGTGAKRQHSRQSSPHEAEKPAPKERNRGKPVVVIDPGHGGIDPGAVGTSDLLEKSVVLSVGLEIRKQLLATGRYDVRMTRTKDVFVSLDQRLKFVRLANADLFISLHADSIEQKSFAQSVRGATVYTLSERASDEQARLMAEKENASDLLAGIDAGEDSSGDEVKSILIDLMKRETSNFSTSFSNLLLSNLRKSVSLSRDPQRSAAFKVLKQTQSPAVLLELGYMSHEEDERLLNSAVWQQRLAQSVKDAVNAFFASQTAGAERNQ
jgi:N-acetylmuramoyl-L-alanine amidase